MADVKGTIENLKNLPPEVKDALFDKLEDAMGITPERAAQFLRETREEDPDQTPEFHREDAVGKFKHFYRTKRGWGPWIDGAWGNIRPMVEVVVDAVIAAEG